MNDQDGHAPTPPEYRRDPVTGRITIVAPTRSRRPYSDPQARSRYPDRRNQGPCPFCPGREHDTPNEVYAVREPWSQPDGPGWRLRVVPNKFPAVEAELEPRALPGDATLLSRSLAGGRHEVVIESGEHVENPSDMSDALFAELFLAYRARLLAFHADPVLAFASVFKNVGTGAGASLAHSHSQILATPFIPEQIAVEHRAAATYLGRVGRCLFCDLIASELAAGVRMIAQTARFVAFAAFAPRFSHETWVFPRRHESRYELISEDEARELGGLMKRLVRAIDRATGERAYNWHLHTDGLRASGSGAYHWHFEILPRTAQPAGFEWGGGCFVTTTAPEAAAASVRAALEG